MPWQNRLVLAYKIGLELLKKIGDDYGLGLRKQYMAF
jgi:hypothetical protein